MKRLEGEQQYSIYERRNWTGPAVPARDVRLLDPAKLTRDPNTSIAINDVSRDCNLIAYQVQKGGADEAEVHIFNVKNGKTLEDELPTARYFGISFAPFFEELFFRGFLLPSLSTAYDWLAERFYHVPRRPLRSDGSPQWSMSAMVIASLVTSAPFALMHAEQTGNSVDAVLLLACVSIVLCAVRLVTRSLAASVLVHSFYNFLIFSMMLLVLKGSSIWTKCSCRGKRSEVIDQEKPSGVP